MNRRNRGTRYEELAATYLEHSRMHVIARNFRCRYGEIDLVAMDEGTLAFVEVKSRADASSGLPEEALSFSKRKTISRVADFYRVRYKIRSDTPCRFDVIAFEGETLRHYKNAFSYIEPF